ncbi:MAG: MotA/TolQ/ExbB proton channel family protein [Planctomycetes bacterium]|nr:MotA/TolQ/ExbB proton channel family protein [Planctomycetota bacterium]
MTFRQVRSRVFELAKYALPALIVLFFAALPLLAQDGAAPAPAENSGDIDLAGDLTIGDLIVLSGFIGWVIIGLSVVTLAVIIENYVTLSRDKLAPPAIIDEVQSLFEEGQFQEAMELCENEPNFFTRVVGAGIAKIGHPYDVIQTAIQEMGDEESIRLNQKIGWISVLAAVSPMLGLFGTVQGMIASFHIIASTANPTPAQLAGGIYVALLTTFEGLMVAIPATAAFAYLRNRLTRNIIEVGAIVEDLFERFRPTGN